MPYDKYGNHYLPIDHFEKLAAAMEELEKANRDEPEQPETMFDEMAAWMRQFSGGEQQDNH